MLLLDFQQKQQRFARKADHFQIFFNKNVLKTTFEKNFSIFCNFWFFKDFCKGNLFPESLKVTCSLPFFDPVELMSFLLIVKKYLFSAFSGSVHLRETFIWSNGTIFALNAVFGLRKSSLTS